MTLRTASLPGKSEFSTGEPVAQTAGFVLRHQADETPEIGLDCSAVFKQRMR